MENNLKHPNLRVHSIFQVDNAQTDGSQLSVEVVALYILAGDSSQTESPDFVFQDSRQIPSINNDEAARDVAAVSPSSVGPHRRGHPALNQDPEAQHGTENDASIPTNSKNLRPQVHRPATVSATAGRKVNWLTDGNGQTLTRALQPLHVSRIIGIGVKPTSTLSLAQASKEISDKFRELWQDYKSLSLVFLCHGYGAFLLKDVIERDRNADLCKAIAAIGLFGVGPTCDISKLKKWTARRYNINTTAPILSLPQDYEIEFGKTLDEVRKECFVSVFTFRETPKDVKGESSNTSSQDSPATLYRVSDRDPVWDGGELDEIATFKGPDDTQFRNMCRYLVESVDGYQLLTAARRNDNNLIKELIKRGANVDGINYTSRDNKTALAIAAEAGHVEIVDFLSTKDYVSLDHGVESESSPLHCALQVIRDRRDEVKKYTEKKSNDLAPWSQAERIVNRLSYEKRLPLEEIRSLDDTNAFDYLVKKLVRTIQVVELLLEAGALPTEGLINMLDDTESQFEKFVKELLRNPPAVQGPSPRRLVMSSPSKDALHVCRKTTFVIREVFAAGKNGKDRYIPLYTDINQVIYQANLLSSEVPSSQDTGPSSHTPSSAGPASRPTIRIQADETILVMPEPVFQNITRSEASMPDTDSQFDMDKEFSRREGSSKVTESQLICRWYHIPMNNMAWVHDLFARLEVHVWPWPQGYRDYKPRSRAVYPQFVKPKPLVTSSTGSSPTVHAIMIPYLSYEKSLRQTLVTKIVDSRSSGSVDEDLDVYEIFKAPRNTFKDKLMDVLANFSLKSVVFRHPTGHHLDFSKNYERYRIGVRESLNRHLKDDSELANLNDDTTELIDAYLYYKHNSGYKLPLHPRRTLDQSHYYMLRDTTYRDRTQVVSRWFRRERRTRHQHREWPGFRRRTDQALSEEENHNILMVDQLWIWLIKEQEPVHETNTTQEKVTLVTSFPDRVGTKSVAHNNIAQQVFRDNNRDPFHTITDLVRQIIDVCLKTLHEGYVDGSVTFLQCFEISLGKLEDQSAQSFLDFRRLSEFLEHLDEDHPKYLSRRGLLLKKLLKISKDSKILSEVKDVLDEIRMIQGVLQEQERVLSDKDSELDAMLGEKKDRAPLHNGLQRMLATFEHMKQRAQSVVNSIERLLDLKQKQANLWEARTSREGSELAARAGNTLWWFTAVTIIFLPLSFMTSFFALDIDKFPKDNDGDTNWPLGLVVGILFGVSLAVIVPLYALAFFSENLQRNWSKICGVWMPLVEIPILWVLAKTKFMSEFKFLWRSSRKLHTVKRYDPKFERNIERVFGEDRTEVIEDDDLDEEDDLIRYWRTYMKVSDNNDEQAIFDFMMMMQERLEKT